MSRILDDRQFRESHSPPGQAMTAATYALLRTLPVEKGRLDDVPTSGLIISSSVSKVRLDVLAGGDVRLRPPPSSSASEFVPIYKHQTLVGDVQRFLADRGSPSTSSDRRAGLDVAKDNDGEPALPVLWRTPISSGMWDLHLDVPPGS